MHNHNNIFILLVYFYLMDISKLMPYIKKAQKSRGDSIGLPSFSLEDKVGKTVSEITRMENPIPFDKKVTNANPKYFHLEIFSDESYILYARVAGNSFSSLHSFLVEGEKIRHAVDLYSPI